MTKRKKMILSIIITFLIIITVIYSTYAFFQATVNSTGDNVTGTTYDASFSVNATEIYKATKLIPVTETNVDATVSKATNQCRDNDNKDVCSLYQIDIVNGTSNLSLNGFVRTNTSTYITDNLKFKVYTKSGNTYTAITDVASISNEAGDSIYFKKNSTNVTTALQANQTQTYYIVFWINEANSTQNDDQEKDYSCRIGFEGVDGSELSVSFNV